MTEPVTIEEMLEILARHGLPEEKIGAKLRQVLEEVVTEQADKEV